MKSSSIFVLIFIGVLFAIVHGTSTEGVTDDVTTVPATQAADTTTVQSGNSDSPTGPTDASGTTAGSATGASSETNAPQSTAAPTTAAPSCPPQDIFIVKDSGTQTFSVNVHPGLNCTYYARSASFSKSITINDPVSFVVTGGEATLNIFGDSGIIYDSGNLTSGNIKSESSQIEINVLTTTGDANVDLILSLDSDTCKDPTICDPNGTCEVIQGQETCKCSGCYIGTRCDIRYKSMRKLSTCMQRKATTTTVLCRNRRMYTKMFLIKTMICSISSKKQFKDSVTSQYNFSKKYVFLY
uniref:EGF-like domain-containing protein n=1 Tax=Panagrolaimus sp. ES5 TaxID=591445 RepID=A0AC34F5P7_9BILA